MKNKHVLALVVAEIFRLRQARRERRARRAPGGSFIWPNTSATFDPSGVGLPSVSLAMTPASLTARVRREQVDDLNAGDQNRGFGRLVDEGGRLATIDA